MKNLILFFALLGTSACEASPLLNHENADDKSNPNVSLSDTKCPLSFPKSGFCAKIEWLVGPNGDEENSFIVKFWDSSTGTTEGPFISPKDDVAVQLWMPSMGHGSSPVTVTRDEPGVYKASRVFFVMPGKWDIRIKLMNTGSLVEQAINSLVIK